MSDGAPEAGQLLVTGDGDLADAIRLKRPYYDQNKLKPV